MIQKCILLIFSIFLLSSCMTSLHRVTSREASLDESGKGGLPQGISTEIPASEEPAFVKRTDVQIATKENPNTTGSLYNLEDERNYLFAKKPFTLGDGITIKIGKLNSKPREKNTEAEKNPTAPPAEADKPKTTSANEDIFKEFPALAPRESARQEEILQSFKAKIIHQVPNGDFVVQYERTSTSPLEENRISLITKVPYEKVIGGEEITTNDLSEITLSESRHDGDITRHSQHWEDEYTLRLSGFSEAKSKEMVDFENKKQDFKQQKEKLLDRIKTFAQDRRKLAEERAQLLNEQKKNKDAIKSLNAKVTSQQAMIQENQAASEDDAKKPADAKEKDGDSNAKK